MVFIKKLVIQGFKSIRDVTVDNLDPGVNVLGMKLQRAHEESAVVFFCFFFLRYTSERERPSLISLSPPYTLSSFSTVGKNSAGKTSFFDGKRRC
jgi:AAA15 family ATPase/GTPase